MTQKDMLQQVYNVVVVGNGEPSLRDQTRDHNKRINKIEENIERRPGIWRSWLTFTILLISMLASILFGIINYIK